jgi:hypothetical protein
MATITTATPAPEVPGPVNHFARLFGAVLSPKKTFTDIAQRPSWVLPFVLVCLLSLVVAALLGQKTDWHTFFERQMSQNSRFDQMSQEQKDQILESQTKYAPKLSFALGVVGAAVSVLFITLIYWGALNLLTGAGLKFGTSFGITSHAFVPSLIGSVLATVTLLLKSRGEVDPEHFLASNVAAYLPESAPHWLVVLGQSLDLFWIWSLVLLVIGFGAANPKKVKPGTAFAIVFGLWAVWVIGRVAIAAL